MITTKKYFVPGPDGETLELVTATMPLRCKWYQIQKAIAESDKMPRDNAEKITKQAEAVQAELDFYEGLMISEKPVFARLDMDSARQLMIKLNWYVQLGELPPESIAVPEQLAPVPGQN